MTSAALALISPPHNAWTASREEGLRRLAAFLPAAGRRYAETRNYDLGPGARPNVSQLSPWIRHRLVREEEVVSAVLHRHSFAAAEKFVQEVAWRTYWKGWLELRPMVWHRYRDAVCTLARQMETDAALRQRWEEAASGRTGIACFDAWVRELVEEGYLHNHARMWFASVWIFTLALPWQLGADLFLRHLKDGDAASNTLSWRWVAGLQTPGKTYLARPDNIERYTAGRFAKVQGLATVARPLSEEPIPALATLPPAENGDPYPESVGLLVIEDDCDPLSLDVPWRKVKAVAGVTASARRSPLPTAEGAAAFSHDAVADALGRVHRAFGCPADQFRDDVDVAAIVDWARASGLRHLVTAYVPVGPAAEWLAELRVALAAAGVGLSQRRRAWDEALWPYATRGFFPFKERLPAALQRLGLTGDEA
jgi:deoxyribodipyrimidine photo-lyase